MSIDDTICRVDMRHEQRYPRAVPYAWTAAGMKGSDECKDMHPWSQRDMMREVGF